MTSGSSVKDGVAEELALARDRIKALESVPLLPNLSALLDEAAAECPDREALNFFETDQSWTYRELKANVYRSANALAAIGIKKNTHVAVMLPNIPQFCAIWLGLARLGAVLVPINTRYTSTELLYVLENSDSSVLVIHSDYVDTYNEVRDKHQLARKAVVGGSADGFVPWDVVSQTQSYGINNYHSATHDDVINIQYTSGTTGLPKGCVLTHLYWLIYGVNHAFRDDVVYKRLLTAAPLFYLDGMWIFIMALYQRSTLYVANRYSVSKYMGWLRAYRINFTILPEPLIRLPEASTDRDHELVRVLVPGIRKEAHALIERRFGTVARESYGMTEIGPGTFVPIEADHLTGSGSCGIPLAFRRIRIVDEAGQDVASGESGELLVKGPGIFKGYYKNPIATEGAFMGEWFRTGDVARADENGCCFIVGRFKDMVRRAGENIASAEVEAVLMELEEVNEAAIVPVPDEVRGEEIKAYIVLKEGVEVGRLSPQRLLTHCSSRLASFKVPRYLEYRTHPLPRTASNKIAKAVLLKEKEDQVSGTFDLVQSRWR